MADDRPEQIGDYVDSIAGNLAPAVISGWLQKVAARAKELCPDSGIEFVSGGDYGDIAIPSKAGVRCVIDSIETLEKDAPDLVKAILASYSARLERQL